MEELRRLGSRGPCRMSVQQASQEVPCEAVPTDGFTTFAEYSSCAAPGAYLRSSRAVDLFRTAARPVTIFWRSLMDTQHLQAFVAVAETGSFSAAGQRLQLTPPAISKRIATLQQQLRSPLFHRVGRKISLTHAGQSLLPNAKRILREVAAAQQAIADLQGEVQGTLSMVTSRSEERRVGKECRDRW